METSATGIFKITTWDEKPCDEGFGGTKVTRATVAQHVSGDIEGEARFEYLMIYRSDGSASFLVAARVSGSLNGRSGGFVLEGKGAYANGVATCELSVTPGAGSGELAGLRGTARFSASHAHYPNVPFELDYRFE